MRILILNGPNLSQLGRRDPGIYGPQSLDEVVAGAREELTGLDAAGDLDHLASEYEGELIARLHTAATDGTDAVVVNPGALTHYSYALRDAIELAGLPAVEVHLSQIAAREEFRRTSVVAPVCAVTIAGAGAYGYRLAVRAAVHLAATS